MTLTPDQMSLRGKVAANIRWSRPGAKQRRRGPLWTKFEREARAADPNASDGAIAERVQSMYAAHMARMAFASSKAAAERRRAREAEPRETCERCGQVRGHCACVPACC